MQKVLRRSLLARNQALRKARLNDKKELKKEEKEFHRDRIMREKALRGQVKAERSARREDWFLGPLAPQRDVGDQKGIYGTISPMAVNFPTVPERHRAEFLNFAVGDIVAVVRGRPKGKISSIKSIDPETMTATVEGVHTVDQILPKYARSKGESRRHQSVELPIPIADLRLVTVYRDQETNEAKQVIVRHMRGGAPFIEREHGVSTPTHTRYIEGLDIQIPWPRARHPNLKAEESDTLRVTVEERTYTPSINPPFPTASVMDELRNPFSLERSRHEEQFVNTKLKEDALEAWKKTRRLLTPQAEYLERRAKENREGQTGAISDDLLQLIKEEQSRTLGRRAHELDAS